MDDGHNDLLIEGSACLAILSLTYNSRMARNNVVQVMLS